MFEFIKNLFKPKTNTVAIAESIEPDDRNYRRISEPQNEKSLNQLSRDQQLKLVFNLWLKNGFAKRLIQLPIDFIVGATMFTPEFKSKNDSIDETKLDACSELIKDFNERNKFASKFEKFATDLSLNGMLLTPCKYSENGDVTIGFIDPSKIDKVNTDPYDVTCITSVKMKTDFIKKPVTFEIVRKKSAFEDVKPEDYDLLDGDAFFYAINNVSNQPEGISDLLPDIDTIQKLYELLVNVVDSVKLANMFVLDTTYKGADATKIAEYVKSNPLPTRPTNRVHNENVETKLLGGTVTAFESDKIIRVIKNFILGNFSFPPMWFADGEDANRAIAIEQGTPVYKKLAKRQELLIDLLKNIYTYVIHSAVRSKEGFELSKDDLESLILEIRAPEIQIKNLDKITASLSSLVTSLDKAEQNRWLTGKTIRKSFISFINLLGFDINVETEEASLENETPEDNPPSVIPAMEIIKDEETIKKKKDDDKENVA